MVKSLLSSSWVRWMLSYFRDWYLVWSWGVVVAVGRRNEVEGVLVGLQLRDERVDLVRC
jgi:hypothetical protein